MTGVAAAHSMAISYPSRISIASPPFDLVENSFAQTQEGAPWFPAIDRKDSRAPSHAAGTPLRLVSPSRPPETIPRNDLGISDVCKQKIRGLPVRYGWHGAQFDCRGRTGLGEWAVRHGLDVAAFLPTIHGVRAIETISRLALPGVDPAHEASVLLKAESADLDGIFRSPALRRSSRRCRLSAGRSSPRRRESWRCCA